MLPAGLKKCCASKNSKNVPAWLAVLRLIERFHAEKQSLVPPPPAKYSVAVRLDKSDNLQYDRQHWCAPDGPPPMRGPPVVEPDAAPLLPFPVDFTDGLGNR